MDPARAKVISDAELVVAVAGGDGDSLRVLYARHAPWLVVRLTRRCGDPAVVEEVIQDTFLAVWNGAGRYAGTGEVAAWIWGISIRRLVDHLRRRRRVPSRGAELNEPSAEDRVLLGLEHGDLSGALDRLSPELCDVVRATILDGLTTREAGRLLGVPSGTVKTRLMRARRELREALT